MPGNPTRPTTGNTATPNPATPTADTHVPTRPASTPNAAHTTDTHTPATSSHNSSTHNTVSTDEDTQTNKDDPKEKSWYNRWAEQINKKTKEFVDWATTPPENMKKKKSWFELILDYAVQVAGGTTKESQNIISETDKLSSKSPTKYSQSSVTRHQTTNIPTNPSFVTDVSHGAYDPPPRSRRRKPPEEQTQIR